MGRFLFYDIPDDDELIHQYLDRLRQDRGALSADIVLEHLLDVATEGRIATGCRPMAENLWALDVPIGYGDTARILFFEVKNGDYLAVHGFTVGREEDADRGFAVAAKRTRDLRG